MIQKTFSKYKYFTCDCSDYYAVVSTRLSSCIIYLVHKSNILIQNIQLDYSRLVNRRLGWVVGFKANCLLVEPGPIGGVSSVVGFLRDPSPYLREFRRKPRKIPYGWVDKRDRELHLALPAYHFISAATGEAEDGQFVIHALPGIRT